MSLFERRGSRRILDVTRHNTSIKKATVTFILLLASCGRLGDPGKEPAGWENLPNAGVAPYVKLDIDEDATNSSQPFITMPQDTQDPTIRPVGGNEPNVVKVGSLYKMWYEDSGRLYYVESADGEHWQGYGSGIDPTPVTWADPSPYGPGAWENGKVAAPSVLFDVSDKEASFKMWYTGGDRTGIGLALSDDGLHWRRTGAGKDPSPVLVPCLAWEGGQNGSIGSPSVIRDDGVYRMWYDGIEYSTDQEGVQQIGYAFSEEGRLWLKSDAEGELTAGGTCAPGQETAPVDPVLTPNPILPCTEEEIAADPQCHDWSLKRNWEWKRVWAPYVMRDDSSQRRIYRMYYTGGTLVLRDPDNLLTLLETHSTSVGYAGSVDGIGWIKQRIGINPVLDEPFALDLGGFMEYYCQTLPPEGDNVFCFLRDALTEVSIRILTNEYGPAVVKDDKEFKMWFRQNDVLNIVLTGLEGVSLAANPPRDIF
jgi:hypothetical protein